VACSDLSEEGIRSLASSLTSHLFAWLSRDLPTRVPSTAVDLLRDAEQYLGSLASEIRIIAQRHDRSNPLHLAQLYSQLRLNPDLHLASDQHFRDLLLRLRQHGYLAGLVCSRDHIFVEEAYYGWKTTLYTAEKTRIAKKAVDYIESGDVIALDAGSTTIQIAHELCSGIRMRSWERLTVVTNSLSAANALLTTAEEVGLEDSNGVIQVYITGGRIRCNTLAIVPVSASVMDKPDFATARSTISSPPSWYSVCKALRQPAKLPRRNSDSVPLGSL
jgi:hypothetical protein